MRVLQAFQPSHQALRVVQVPVEQQEPSLQQLAEEEPPLQQLAEEPTLQLAAEEGPVLGLPMHAYLVQLLQPEKQQESVPPLQAKHLLQAEEEQDPVLPLQPKHQLQVGEEQDPVLPLQPKHQLQVGEEQDPVLPLQPKHQLQVGEEQTHGLHVHQIIQPARLEETSLQCATSPNNKQSVKIVSVNQAKLALKYL